ncbi:MAG TPA: hypothetical protein VMM13_07705 [Euzebya sp.]|nr:hypothetical protein [Euzebya sp.]
MTTDAHAEALYGGDPASFVARRDDLVRQLRADGDRDMAQAVKALRRPTSAAAALNRVAREDPDLVAACLAAAEDLTRTQRRVLSGLPDADVRGAVRAHHAAIASVLAAAGPQTVAVTDAMRATLLTAAVDDDVAEALQRGVLAVTATQGDPSAALLGSAPLTALKPRPRLAVVDRPQDDDAQDETQHGEAQDDPGGQATRDAARARAAGAAARKAAAARVASAERALGAAQAEQVATARRRRAATAAAQTAADGVAAGQVVVDRLRDELARAEDALRSAQDEVGVAQMALDEVTTRDAGAARRISEAEGTLREAQHDLDALGDAP